MAITKLAQELIEKEKVERTGYLDLGRCGLTEVPDLSDLEWLETLIFANEWWDWEKNEIVESSNSLGANKISMWPKYFLPYQVKNLIFGNNNRFNDIDLLENFKNLRVLNLFSDKENNWSVFKRNSKLEVLLLSSNCYIDTFSFEYLEDLKALFIDAKVSSLQFLKKNKKIKLLALSGSDIKDWSFVSNLTSLEFLVLNENNIQDLSFLKTLANLKVLDLSYNNIEDLSQIGNLSNLIELHVSCNNLSKVVHLEGAVSLEELHAHSNCIKTLSGLEKLHSIRFLDFSSNEIDIIQGLNNLINLNELNLSSNRISIIENLDKLHDLSCLNISGNKIENIQGLDNLVNLNELDLSSNQISDIIGLDKLNKINYLNLSSNAIKNIQGLDNLTELRELDLHNNQISNIKGLDCLNNLISLNLSSNEIEEIKFLGHLKLESLDMSSNDLINYKEIGEIKSLKILYLGRTRIKDLSFLENLNNINSLDLWSNQISDLNNLKRLPNLKRLFLRHCNISDLSFLKGLKNLDLIDLASNEIVDLYDLYKWAESHCLKIIWGDDLWGKIETGEIDIYKNPIKNPPLEIVKQGSDAILDYFIQKERSGITQLNEAKLILLGDGRAGKTSLANRLIGKALPKEIDRTLGVDIIIGEHRFLTSGNAEFTLHIWDFAGQDKYKPLHQFFYTEGAVYVLVVDSGNANTDYDDWFQTAQLFGGGSPVLVVLNEFREGVGLGTFNPEYWQKRFPNLLKEHFWVNLLTQKNFELLKKSIHSNALNLPHVQMEYPANWATIRRILELRRDENFISFTEYMKICSENGLSERESAVILSGILHRIGVCLHYQQSDLLRQYVILKNEWATEAVYKILEDQQVAEVKKGFFNWDDLRRIWSNEHYSEMRPQLLELMQQFKMAYPLRNSQEFVAPPLLPIAPPQGWEFPIGACLEIFNEYEFLPKALLTQFIVSRHTDIDKERTLVWRNGVVLRWPDALAEVVKTKSQGRDAFGIRSQGTNRKGLLTAILKTFRDLHSEYKGIKVSEIVPCSCIGCRSGKNKQHYFDFENLKNRLEKGRRIVECDQSLEEVELMALLGDLLVFEHLSVGEPLVMKNNNIVRLDAEPKSAPLAFFSYSKADTTHLKEFQKHLRPLERSGKIRLWDDLKTQPGEKWDETIQNYLNTADIIFLLLSPDFLNTEYIWDIEMEAAIRRDEAGTARVIPIKVRPCAWEDTPFSKLQGLPRKDQVISTAEDQDAIWLEVVKEIKGILEDWR